MTSTDQAAVHRPHQLGRAGRGSRLPLRRQLAADLGLAVATVARTYRELEVTSLVVSRRGGGTTVAAGVTRRSAEITRAIDDATQALVRGAQLHGAHGDDVRTALERARTTRPGRVRQTSRIPSGQACESLCSARRRRDRD